MLFLGRLSGKRLYFSAALVCLSIGSALAQPVTGSAYFTDRQVTWTKDLISGPLRFANNLLCTTKLFQDLNNLSSPNKKALVKYRPNICGDVNDEANGFNFGLLYRDETSDGRVINAGHVKVAGDLTAYSYIEALPVTTGFSPFVMHVKVEDPGVYTLLFSLKYETDIFIYRFRQTYSDKPEIAGQGWFKADSLGNARGVSSDEYGKEWRFGSNDTHFCRENGEGEEYCFDRRSEEAHKKVKQYQIYNPDGSIYRAFDGPAKVGPLPIFFEGKELKFRADGFIGNKPDSYCIDEDSHKKLSGTDSDCMLFDDFVVEGEVNILNANGPTKWIKWLEREVSLLGSDKTSQTLGVVLGTASEQPNMASLIITDPETLIGVFPPDSEFEGEPDRVYLYDSESRLGD